MLLLLASVACGRQQEKTEDASESMIMQSYVAQGDSMMYGLACDGCSDSVLVLLPDSGGDPISYSIVRAMRERQIFGRPQIGDKMAVRVNPENPKELLVVIDLEQVKGTWYYVQSPQLREHLRSDSMTAILAELSDEERARLDSALQSMMVPREYVYTLKRDFTVMSSGGPPRANSLEGELPVVYPPLTRYMEWHVFNGKIIFTSGGYRMSGTNDSVPLRNDTAEFVLLRRDTMALRFRDHVQGFRLKPDSTLTDEKR